MAADAACFNLLAVSYWLQGIPMHQSPVWVSENVDVEVQDCASFASFWHVCHFDQCHNILTVSELFPVMFDVMHAAAAIIPVSLPSSRTQAGRCSCPLRQAHLHSHHLLTRHGMRTVRANT